MKKRFLSLLGASLVCLSSCGAGGVHHDISEYFLKDVAYTTNFKILQMTDIHMSDSDDQDLQYRFMQKTIDDANANMIVITGDVFTYASKATIQRLFAFFDKQGVPWTLTWGNHDEQIYCSVDWMTGELNKMYKSGTSNVIFYDYQDDDVTGNANFAINLKKDGQIFEQLIVMDSNRYHYGFDYMGYDYFHEDQINWYKDLTTATKAQAGGSDARTLMFYHIPLPEVDLAYTEGTIEYGEKNEDCCPPKYNSGFFEVIKANRPNTSMFFGHDHVNNFRAVYQGIRFCYGIKATERIYSKDNMLGGLVITIKEDHSLEFDPILHTYEEVM